MSCLRRCAFVALAAAVLLAAGVALYTRAGIYNVAATRQHVPPVFWLLSQAKLWSIRSHARGVDVPDLAEASVAEGERAYLRHCLQCHGAPGLPPDEVGRGMTPVPPNLADIARTRSAAEIFWATKHGIKSAGMPAWQFRMGEDRIWAIVAFVKTLPEIVPADYRRRTARVQRHDREHSKPGGQRDERLIARKADPERGRIAIQQYGCTACHTVPGIPGRDTLVGPPLAGLARRPFIAGIIPNTPANMVHWLRGPTAVDPLTAMPDLGVTRQHARDMAAYLSTLR